jgi:D-xylose transport system permease protein
MSTSPQDAAVAGEPTPDASGGGDNQDLEPTSDSTSLGSDAMVADSFSEYVSAQWVKIRGGESGVLPVLLGLIVIIIVFQTKNGKFLSGLNLVNLLDQGAFIIMLAMAEVFVLLLGEIDLSAGFNMAVGAIITAELAAPPHNVAWWLAILAGIASCVVISTVVGLLVTRLRLPSFIVSLAFFLGLQGVILSLFSHDSHSSGGNINISNHVLTDVVNGNLTPTAGWIVMAVSVVAFGALNLFRDQRRRRSGLVTPPIALTLVKIGLVAVAGIVVVLVCNPTVAASSSPSRACPGWCRSC